MAATGSGTVDSPQKAKESKATNDEQDKKHKKRYKKFKILLSTYNETIVLRKDVM